MGNVLFGAGKYGAEHHSSDLGRWPPTPCFPALLPLYSEITSKTEKNGEFRHEQLETRQSLKKKTLLDVPSQSLLHEKTGTAKYNTSNHTNISPTATPPTRIKSVMSVFIERTLYIIDIWDKTLPVE